MTGFKAGSFEWSEDLMIGFTAGSFDLLHAGHVMMLEEAKGVCDHLIVGLHVDPSLERQLQLGAIKYVDQVVVYSTEKELEELLFAYEVDIRIIGEEYEGYLYTGKGFTQYVHYNKRNHGYSTTELRKRVCNDT